MKKNTGWKTLLYAGLIFYSAFVLWTILFKYVMPWQLLDEARYFSRSLNLIPFGDVAAGKFTSLDIYGNVLIFVPMGIYFSMLFKHSKIYQNVIKIVLVSAGLEILQYVLAIGASDVTDIITNTMGGILGIGIYYGIRLIAKTEERTNKFILVCSAVALIFTAGISLLLLVVNA